MPAQRPRATFNPISPDFDLDALVEETPNFQYVDRISCDEIDRQGMDAFDKLVLLHVVIGGKPLVVDGYQGRLDPWTFSSKWLQDNHGDKVENSRDLRKDNLYTPLTIRHYLRNMSKLADQYFEKADNFRDLDRQRVYLKDIDVPQVWHDKLREHLPPNLFYLNDCVGQVGGPGAIDETAAGGGKRKGKGIAPAGDLMSSLPPSMRAENMMCYIGHEGTYTPAHREMCASLGHNIMVENSDVLGEDGKAEKPGSSIWFMTETKDRHSVSEYWLSLLGHDIEVEKHFAQVAAWKKAPFTTYVVEQRAGDFILIPPLAPHQVWNRGTRTMKAAWNRTTVETLEMAFKEALPNARMVCRDEQYKNKAIVYYTLQKYSTLLSRFRDQQQTAPTPQELEALKTSPKIRQLQKDFKRLFNIFKEILLSEMFALDSPHEKNVQFFPFDSNITCAYCRGNIFNRFLTCSSCDDVLGGQESEPYDVCMDCFAMGRSCGCISKLRWAEQFKWKELSQQYEQWRRQYLELDGGAMKRDSPLQIQEEQRRLPKKTLAHVCQEQLRRRPWVDVRKSKTVEDDEESEENEEIEINDDGTVKKKKKKRRSEAWLKNHHTCHVCCHRHEKWRMAECKCGRWWCYGTLFRAHDLMPREVMEDLDWQCPHCKGICSAGACRKDPRQTPYEPKGTLLGHDTRRVADARSVESLVDFSVSNLNWLKESVEAPVENARLRKRQEEADLAKLGDTTMDEQYATDGDDHELNDARELAQPAHAEDQSLAPTDLDNSVIDPSLQEASTGTTFKAINRPSAAIVPAVSSLLNGATSDPQEESPVGYRPAGESGYVAPSAVMYRPPQPDAEGDQEEEEIGYPARDSRSPVSRKRKVGVDDTDEIKRTGPPKRRRAEDLEGKPLSGATKQFRKEQERKALEEARKAGRYIQLRASLNGRSKIVKLAISRDGLARILSNEQRQGRENDNVLLQSDVAPPESPKMQVPSQTIQSKPSKSVRVRVERDDDFDNRHRGRKKKSAGSTAQEKQTHIQGFEELDIESESEPEDIAQVDGAFDSKTSGGRRRTSAWQSRRHHDDPESLPNELPEDWRDGKVAPKRRNRHPGPSHDSVVNQENARKSIAGSASRSEKQDNLNKTVTSKPAEVASDDTPARGMHRATAALKRLEEDDNQREKVGIAGLFGRTRNGVSSPDDTETISIKPVASESALVTNGSSKLVSPDSILAKRRPDGRKIKIVGSKKKL